MKEAKHHHNIQSTVDLEERTVKKNTEDCAVKIKTALEKMHNSDYRCIISILYSFYLVWDFIPVQLLLYICVHMCTSVYLYKYLYSWNIKCNKILRSETNLFYGFWTLPEFISNELYFLNSSFPSLNERKSRTLETPYIWGRKEIVVKKLF